VKTAALMALIIGALLVNQGHARDVSTQPLTRVDCDMAGMAWDDSANVCGGPSQVAETGPETQDARPAPTSEISSSQPLTRPACDRAGMAWNDTANVCGAASQASETSTDAATQIAPREPETTVLINIDKTTQTLRVIWDGVQRYEWPISTGLRGYSTPSGTYTASSMHEIWYSKEWDDAPMPHAIFFTRKGHAIHGTNETKKLGRPASHGCVRLAPANARTLFALVKENGLANTQIDLSGETPGGESKVASKAPRKHATRGKSSVYSEWSEVRRYGRRGWFRRHYAAPRWLPHQPFYMGRPPSQRGWR
jgi:lipoprotein-anchoring transpeptidase ErfK/SrfK